MDDRLEPGPDQRQLARQAWDRYEYGKARGHGDYCARAKDLEGFYLGGGLQWREEERQAMQDEGRPALEFNEILPAINAALGYQIHNRLDIAFRPRGREADQATADALSKVAMQIADRNALHWVESQVFADGLIEQRGYYDVRVSFDASTTGEVTLTALDPLDVVPDPDAKSYDPDHWSDVLVTRWLSLDEVETLYGEPVRLQVEEDFYAVEGDFGDGDHTAPRNKFGPVLGGAYWRWDSAAREGSALRVRALDWQRHQLKMTRVAVYPDGDVYPVKSPQEAAEAAGKGAVLQRRMMKQIRWSVTTAHHVLQDGWSPYRHFTVVPYFPFFRRGLTRGLVDNAVDPQRALNKAISQYVHILNTTANSGYRVQQNSLTNLTTEELQEVGGKTGLVLEYREGADPPDKIPANPIPQGVDNLIERAMLAVRETTVPEAMRGINSQELTGIAIQSRQFAAQQQLAVPLDNLARTRTLLAERLLDLVQTFYSDTRIFLITDTDPMGRERQSELVVNHYDPGQGRWLNDLTIGKYDVVISEQPMQVTFENSQFTQALELRKAGLAIPDPVIIRHSNLADKEEIIDQMEQAPSQADPVQEAEAALKRAQADKTRAERVNQAVEALFSATQAARLVAENPLVAEAADRLLRSAGYQDQDAPPIVPQLHRQAMAGAPMPADTHPLHPAPPDADRRTGMAQAPRTHEDSP